MSNVDDIFWRRFGAILVGLTIFGVIVAFIARDIAGDSFKAAMNSPGAVAERLAPEGQVRVGDPSKTVEAAPAATVVASAAAPAAADEGESVYQSACVACHLAGVAGAPKLGDEAAWVPRIALGQDALVASVINGKGAMPPRGGNANLTDEQITAAVAYMLVKASPEATASGAAPAAVVEAVKDVASETAETVGKAVEKAADKAADMAGQAVDKASDMVQNAADKASDMAGSAADSAKAAAGTAVAAVAPAAAGGDGKPGDEVYNMGCVACHATGAANAPKLTDKAAWETRVAAGMETLVTSAVKGKGAMPAKGGLATLSDADVRNAVVYMLEEAGVSAN